MSRSFASAATYRSWPEGWGRPGHFKNIETSLWNFHWVAGLMDWPRLLPYLVRRAPVIWTLHDLSPLSGVWHYRPFEDEQNNERTEWDEKAREMKKRVFDSLPSSGLRFVAPSRWIADQCRLSPLTSRFKVTHIPNGLPLDVYRPMEKPEARAMLGLSSDGIVAGFLADSVTDRRKGMKELEEALDILPASLPLKLITAGGGDPSANGLNRIHLGPLRDEDRMRAFYSACDLFVCPSLQDNLPNTVLESMACGTPVLGFDVGGLPDMIEHGETGYLIGLGNIRELSEAISAAVSDRRGLEMMGLRARERAERLFSLNTQAIRYKELYAKVLDAV